MKLFVMYIGLERDSQGQPISDAAKDMGILLLKEKLAADFGGYSVGEVMGGYHMYATGGLVEERALRVEVTATEEQTPQIKECAQMFKKMFRQESILLNCTTIETEFV